MRAAARFTLGDKGVVVFPDGRVLVMVPPTETAFGCVMSATVVYPSLRTLLRAGVLRSQRDD